MKHLVLTIIFLIAFWVHIETNKIGKKGDYQPVACILLIYVFVNIIWSFIETL